MDDLEDLSKELKEKLEAFDIASIELDAITQRFTARLECTTTTDLTSPHFGHHAYHTGDGWYCETCRGARA